MSIIILGLDINDYNTSAAIVIDGEVKAAAQEERFTREKLTRRFPSEAMRFCLRQTGLAIGEVDAVAISVNPAIYLENLSPAQSERARFRGELLYSPVNYILGSTPGANARSARLSVEEDVTGGVEIHYVTHHDAHAAAAFYLSPFDSCAALSIDGFGEKESAVYYSASGSRMNRLVGVEFPNSAGCFYAAITEFLGMKPFRHEWKLMGAAANGNPDKYLAAMKSLIRYAGGGQIEAALPYFNYYQFHRPGFFSPKMAELLGAPYPSRCGPDERFFDIAAAAQRALEDVVFEMLGYLHETAPSDNLCMSGGVAMNCVLNGKIAANTPFKNIFVPPAPDDSGTSVGAAMRVYHETLRAPRCAAITHNYFGPAFSDSQIEAELLRTKARYEKLGDPCATAANFIADGMLVGWFQDGMEFGDRALGNRSVLGDPRDADVPERINSLVKDRESFQPFAPSVLAERAGEFFAGAGPSPFMEKTFFALPEKCDAIPAVLGADGSARVQTVTVAQNEKFHRLIEAFDRITGVPMVLNTSFNLRGEPIVCAPRDALRTFFSSGLDALFLGPFVIRK